MLRGCSYCYRKKKVAHSMADHWRRWYSALLPGGKCQAVPRHQEAVRTVAEFDWIPGPTGIAQEQASDKGCAHGIATGVWAKACLMYSLASYTGCKAEPSRKHPCLTLFKVFFFKQKESWSSWRKWTAGIGTSVVINPTNGCKSIKRNGNQGKVRYRNLSVLYHCH